MYRLYAHVLSTIAATSTGVAGTGWHAQKHKLPLIPPASARDAGRLVVVLDMDETLLTSDVFPFRVGSDQQRVDDDMMDALVQRKWKSKQESSKMKQPEHRFIAGEGTLVQARVRTTLRPGLREFLLAVSAEFEPILFTAGHSGYARPLLDLVEGPAPGDASITVPTDAPVPKELHPIFRHRLYREATIRAPEIDYDYVKDLRLLGRDMRRTILIEDRWEACVYAPDNSILVPEYQGAAEDNALESTLALLREAATYEDVRPFLREKLRFREVLEKEGVKLKGFPKEGQDIVLKEQKNADEVQVLC
jgi:hypothetical protein